MDAREADQAFAVDRGYRKLGNETAFQDFTPLSLRPDRYAEFRAERPIVEDRGGREMRLIEAENVLYLCAG